MVEPRHRWREEGGSPPLSLSSIPERRGRASGAVRPPVRSQGRPPLSSSDHDPLGGGRTRRTPRAPLFPGSGARAHTQRRCPLTPRTAHHTPLVAVLQSAARARCTGPTCGRRYERRGSPRGSAPTTSNAPPWHRGADDQAQRMTPGKRSRASTIAAGRRAAPSHGGRAAAARNLRHNANRARPSTGKHTPRLGHSVPRARERGWLLAREGSFRDPLQDHARIIPRPRGRRDCNQSSRAACRSTRAPWASGWRAGDAALSAQRRVPDGVRPRVTREVRSGCVAAAPLAECLVLWFCVSLLCDRHRPSSVHPYRVGVPVVGRTVFRLPINQSIRDSKTPKTT